jgi:hypothetical protein
LSETEAGREGEAYLGFLSLIGILKRGDCAAEVARQHATWSDQERAPPTLLTVVGSFGKQGRAAAH